jgi:hypothetical protein
VIRGWATLADWKTLTRERVLEANDLLDALDEAQAEAPRTPPRGGPW